MICKKKDVLSSLDTFRSSSAGVFSVRSVKPHVNLQESFSNVCDSETTDSLDSPVFENQRVPFTPNHKHRALMLIKSNLIAYHVFDYRLSYCGFTTRLLLTCFSSIVRLFFIFLCFGKRMKWFWWNHNDYHMGWEEVYTQLRRECICLIEQSWETRLNTAVR